MEGAATHLERAVQGDLDTLIRTCDLPWVRASQPVVRTLPLPAVLDRLPEHAVLVAHPVAHRGQLHRRHRVEEARSESAEAAVAEASVGLLLEQAHPVEVLLRDDLFREWIEQEIHDVVGERTADQELHREVVDALRVLALVGSFRAYPSLGQDVTYGAREGLEAFAWSGSGGIDDAVEDEMAFVEPIGIPCELNGAAAVLLAKGGRWISVFPGHLRRLSHPLAPPRATRCHRSPRDGSRSKGGSPGATRRARSRARSGSPCSA